MAIVRRTHLTPAFTMQAAPETSRPNPKAKTADMPRKNTQPQMTHCRVSAASAQNSSTHRRRLAHMFVRQHQLTAESNEHTPPQTTQTRPYTGSNETDAIPTGVSN
jgi:hypothetical protein